MKKFVKGIICLSALVYLATLTACGGGGGGSSFSPIPYTGATTQATVDASNAADLSNAVITGFEISNSSPLIASASTQPQMAPTGPVLLTLLDISQKLPEKAKVLQSSTDPLVRATIPSTTEACTVSGSVTISGSYTSTSMSADVSFNSCDEGEAVMNGQASMTLTSTMSDQGFPDTMPPAIITLSLTFKNLTTSTTTGDDLTVYANIGMTIDQSLTPPQISTSMTMVVRDNVSGLSGKLENLDITVFDYGSYQELNIISGRVYDYVAGYVDISTLSPLQDNGGIYPISGILRMDGANGSFAEIDYSFNPPQVTWDDGQGGSGTTTL